MKKVAHPYEIQNTFVIYTKVFDHIITLLKIEDLRSKFVSLRTKYEPILLLF